ncbi:MAG TPA: hypothetical protein VK619_16630 [Pyrinomonadaceae bacterium]|nr:hypothetical protein [Pyrinomonadaceae bacterium]
MKTLTAGKRGVAAHAGLMGRRRERLFYTGMAVAIVATVFAGFARTYYLRTYFGAPPLMPLLHLHGIVFTSWLVLFIAQTTLVAAKRIDVHRRLGIVGGVIAVLMVVVGAITAVVRAKQGAAPTGDTSPLAFLVIPLGDLLVFSILVGAGFYFRRRADVHKRLMLLATISILAAAIARLPFDLLKAGPPAFFGLTDLFILACLLYDLIRRKRVHRATVLGGLLIIASQPLRLMIASTHAWIAFATWLTQWVS